MRNLFIACIAAGLAMVGPLAPAAYAQTTKGEQKLAKLLKGRVAGEPQACIRTAPSRAFRIIDDTAIVYEDGDTVWVNIPQDPRSLDRNDYLVVDKFGTSAFQTCKYDQIRTFQTNTNFYTGNIFLTDFVPYRKPEKQGG